jgi:glycosyltransferase involved in cell wall biosynthesis
MKILYTITAYPPSTGGAQIHTHLLAQEMQKDFPVQVITFWDNYRNDWLLGTTIRAERTPFDYQIDGIPVHRIGIQTYDKIRMLSFVFTYYLLMPTAISQLSAIIEPNIEPFVNDATFVHNIRVGREPLSYASLQLARKHKIPFIFTPLHHPRWVGWRYQAYIDLYKEADALLAMTHVEKNILMELGVREERIFVTGVGPVLAKEAHPEQFCIAHQIDGPIVLFLGQHYRYKGYRQLLDAAPLVWKTIPDAHFVFIGPSTAKVDLEFSKLSDPRIHFLGRVDLQEKTNALAASHLLCVPSSQESFGGVYTEAWSYAKPVIGCNIPAVAELVTDGETGFLVEQKPAEIAERICYLLLNPTLAEKMGQTGLRKVQTHYKWDIIAQKTAHAYRSTLSKL